MIIIDNQLTNLGINLKYIIGNNVTIAKTDLEEIKDDLVRRTLDNWSEIKVNNDPILSEYRRLHQATIGEKGKEYIASPEWLVKYILQNKRFISINNIV